MGKLSERLGKWDEQNKIYPTEGGGFGWRRFGITYVLVSIVVGALIWGVGLLVGEGAAIAAVFGVTLVGLVVYVVWRRNRNRRLTGSPTEWPEAR